MSGTVLGVEGTKARINLLFKSLRRTTGQKRFLAEMLESMEGWENNIAS